MEVLGRTLKNYLVKVHKANNSSIPAVLITACIGSERKKG